MAYYYYLIIDNANSGNRFSSAEPLAIDVLPKLNILISAKMYV